jgi:hypothetical protein
VFSFGDYESIAKGTLGGLGLGWDQDRYRDST